MSGGQIYLITNVVNGKVYVGQTRYPLMRRLNAHFLEAFAGRTTCAIHRAMAKYGKDAFTIETLETCASTGDLNVAEVKWISFYKALGPAGYNLTTGGGVGASVSDETRAKMSKANLGRRHTEGARAKMSLAKTGVKMGAQSEQHRLNISAANKGKTRSEEVCRAIAARELPPLSSEAREKIASKLRGLEKSQETREKLAAANIGKKASPEARANMRRARLAYLERMALEKRL